jgi:predicted 3-demethylubiquinone-9 3-methyltransferase (glyoxalase superfamily)
MGKVTPFLMFNGNVEEAVNFWKSVFKDVRVENASAMSATFVIEGQEFLAFNGGDRFQFSEAVSFFISCADQAEVDYFWDKLTGDGGAESNCGWVKDKFGLSWQVVPDALIQLASDRDPKKGQAVMAAMLQMKKIEIAGLEAAYAKAA